MGILYRAGTFDSGYHFMDDHELIRLELSFQENASLWGTIKTWIINDFHWRFRPFYWVERVIGAYFMGSKLFYWNIYTAVKGVLTFYLLYCTVRFNKYGRLVSVIFPAVIMLGAQFTPWYRSANQENTGLLLCAFTLCMIAAQYYYGRFQNAVYNALIVLGAVLCGLTKESFTLFMPVFIALKLWLEYWDGYKHDEGKVRCSNKGRFLKLLKENFIVYALIVDTMLVNVGMLLFKVGVDKVSYAGFKEETTLEEYMSGIKISLLYYTKEYTYFGVLILFMVALCYQLIEKREIKKYISLCAIGCYVLVVQLIAHASSGMWERYIIPYIVGYALLFVLLGYRIFGKDAVRRKIYLVALLLLLLLEIPEAQSRAANYAYDGQMVKLYFQCILDNTTEKDRIVSAFSDEELNLATECWLEVHCRTQVYSNDNGEWNDHVQLIESTAEEYSWENVEVVTCYSGGEAEVLERMGNASAEQFDVHGFGKYAVMVRKVGE